jgi:hypothetical protein
MEQSVGIFFARLQWLNPRTIEKLLTRQFSSGKSVLLKRIRGNISLEVTTIHET